MLNQGFGTSLFDMVPKAFVNFGKKWRVLKLLCLTWYQKFQWIKAKFKLVLKIAYSKYLYYQN